MSTKEEQELKPPAIVALGFFDGVHVGHQQIIKEMFKPAYRDLVPTVFTYQITSNCPNAKKNQQQILTTEEKLKKLEFLGVKQVVSPDFNEIARMSAEFFFQEWLVNRLHAQVVVCGKNFRFGHQRMGNTKLLKSLCKENNMKLVAKPLFSIAGEIVSSSLIRKLLQKQQQSNANALLLPIHKDASNQQKKSLNT
ncbi:MAG: FAD synthetase family protein [Oscillospiraceae bacterium]|nr:FAD synthetase family protein [Oscillospiraceae bacterium]